MGYTLYSSLECHKQVYCSFWECYSICWATLFYSSWVPHTGLQSQLLTEGYISLIMGVTYTGLHPQLLLGILYAVLHFFSAPSGNDLCLAVLSTASGSVLTGFSTPSASENMPRYTLYSSWECHNLFYTLSTPFEMSSHWSLSPILCHTYKTYMSSL